MILPASSEPSLLYLGASCPLLSILFPAASAPGVGGSGGACNDELTVSRWGLFILVCLL